MGSAILQYLWSFAIHAETKNTNQRAENMTFCRISKIGQLSRYLAMVSPFNHHFAGA